MIVKSLAAGVAAVAAVGAAASGIAPTVTLTATNPAAARVALAVFGQSPQPVDVVTDVPTSDQLTGVLNSLADPGVPFADKAGLVEGGVGPVEASMADHKLQKAARKGELPLSFSVVNIEPAGPDTATADVSVSGPKLATRTINMIFVDQDGWKLSSGSATSLLQAASGK
jgi:hypothetical protein